MRAQLMCLTSGCVGGLLVLACGAVDGAGSKVAIAEDVSLRIYVEVGDCVDSDDNYLPDSMELFLEPFPYLAGVFHFTAGIFVRNSPQTCGPAEKNRLRACPTPPLAASSRSTARTS